MYGVRGGRALTRMAVAAAVAAAPTAPTAPASPVAAAVPAAVAAQCAGSSATIVGTPGDDRIRGTAGRDVVVAGTGDDRVVGLGGNDLLCGGRGADLLLGGGGRDRLLGGGDAIRPPDDEGQTYRAGDTLDGGSGDDVLVPGLDDRPADEAARDLLSWASAGAAVRADLARGVVTGAASGADRLVGTRYAVATTGFGDRVRGSDRADQVLAGAGADLVVAGGGRDQIHVDDAGAGADEVRGGAGADQVTADGGIDLLYGGPGPDVLADGGSGVDRVAGGAGDDLLVDVLWTGSFTDQVLSGGSGRDALSLSTFRLNPGLAAASAWLDLEDSTLLFRGERDARATVAGIEVVDLSRDGASWWVGGSAGDDEVSAAGEAGTEFVGRGGDDVFSGSAGDDRFDGGAGHDVARYLGEGADVCVSVEVIEFPDCEDVRP